SRHQAVLRGRTVPGAAGEGAAQPHRVELARLLEDGMSLFCPRAELVSGETGRNSPCCQDLPRQPEYATPAGCVTPTRISEEFREYGILLTQVVDQRGFPPQGRRAGWHKCPIAQVFSAPPVESDLN